MTVAKLSTANLPTVANTAAIPTYVRSGLQPGIVHFGVGGFNRSHLAVYLDDLLQQPSEPRWGECGVGLLPGDLKINKALARQNHLYSVLTRDADLRSLRVIGSLTEHIFAPEESGKVLQRLCAPECEIVSMTVTEGGYFIEDSSKRFCSEHPDVQHDLAYRDNPRTFLGYLALAAEHRMRTGGKPFTVMSCDNVQGNGEVARQALVSFAKLRDEKLAAWIEANIAFPNSMVDRITPATTEEDRRSIADEFGMDDEVPVVTEPFRQWVIEDTFSGRRPRFELVGAQMAADVKPYEITKMRLLNGGHSTLAYVGALLGHTFVSEAITDPSIASLVQAYLEETTPSVPIISGLDLTAYKASITHRFANPTIRDQVMRICSEASAKISKFILPAVTVLMEQRRQPRIIPFVIASWLHALSGRSEQGQSFAVTDSSAHLFSAFVESGCSDARLALNIEPVFGDLPHQFPQFASDVQMHLRNLREAGVRPAIAQALAAQA